MEPFRLPPVDLAAKKAAEIERGPSSSTVVPTPRPKTFSYVDEASIEDELKCPVCLDPLYEPVSHAACGNMFCAQCIKPLKACPLCRADVTEKDVQGVARYITNKLSVLKVACNYCKVTLQRGDFPSHLLKCQPRPSSSSSSGGKCPAADVCCPFTGTAAEMQAHAAACPYVVMRPLIKNLESQIQAQKKANDEHLKKIADLTAASRQQLGLAPGSDAQEAAKKAMDEELQAISKQLHQRLDKIAADVEANKKHLHEELSQQAKQFQSQIQHVTQLTADMQNVEKNLQEQIQSQAKQLLQFISENERMLGKLTQPRPASASAAAAPSSSSSAQGPAQVTIVQGSAVDTAAIVNSSIQNFDTLAQRILLQSQQIQMIVQDLERTKSVVQQQFQISGQQFEQLYLDYENTKKVLQAYSQLQNSSIEKVAAAKRP